MTSSSDRNRVLRVVARLLPFVIVACQWPGSTPDVATTVPTVEIGPAISLEDALVMLRAQLDTAAAGLDEAGVRSMARVESISDRLLETRLPFAWMNSESYSLEARLRQIQSRADRAEALRTSGARRDEVDVAVTELLDAVLQLQADLAGGGGPAPRPIERILSALDTVGR